MKFKSLIAEFGVRYGIGELKLSLTIDALRQMSAGQLANLATDKAAKRQVENLVGGGTLGRSAIIDREKGIAYPDLSYVVDKLKLDE